MLDIRFMRENSELVQEKSKQKGYDVDIRKLLELDGERKQLMALKDEKRRQINEHAALFKETKGPTSEENVEKGKLLKDELNEIETQLSPIESEFMSLFKSVPNMPADDVPVGASEAENVVSKEWGEKPQFDFQPKSHWEIAESRGLIDKERAAKVAGSRFAYIKGDLVKLQFAIIQFSIETLTNEETLKKIIKKAGLNGISSKPFVPVLPPLMIRTDVFEAMDRLEPRDDRYKVGSDEDNLWLQGSAEHVLGSMHMKEDIPYEDLPLRYLGYATSFRREAGNYGKDTEGIFRLHQFDKLEMESITDESSGPDEHKLLVAVQEYLMQALGIAYRVVKKCTADIGKPNANGVDIEAWLPSQNRYRETHTADYMTDYQSRRMNMLYRRWIPAMEYNSSDPNPPSPSAAGSKVFLTHTNDATAFALGRTMVAILENYQNQDGTVRVPQALRPYMGQLDSI